MGEDLEHRVRALGTEPVSRETAAGHLSLMQAEVASVDTPRRFGRLAVAGAAMIGFLAGSTGLAAAGALPDPAQQVVHDVLSVVSIDVPAGQDDKRGPCVAAAAKIADKDDKQAAKDECPKGPFGPPVSESESDEVSDSKGVGPPDEDDPCRGRPEWAGPMSPEDRAAAKEANSREGCPDDENEVDGTETDDLDTDNDLEGPAGDEGSRAQGRPDNVPVGGQGGPGGSNPGKSGSAPSHSPGSQGHGAD